jgi:AcrR family transcriptional regulator
LEKVTKSSKSREKFLNAAEYLFSEHGYEGTKIREIADRSKVNLGSLHYYWGNKEELFSAVCERRLQGMNDERMQRFNTLLENRKVDDKPINLMRDLFKASIEPTFFLYDFDDKEQATFRKLYGRVMTEPSPLVGKIMRKLFAPVSRHFFNILRDLCPHLTDDEFYWRAMCLFGSFLYAPAYSSRMTFYANDDFDANDSVLGIAEIVEFLTAGMLAAPSSSIE